MPTIEGGGIEKNLLILTDFFCKKKFTVYLFYSNLNKNIEQKLNQKIIAENYAGCPCWKAPPLPEPPKKKENDEFDLDSF